MSDLLTGNQVSDSKDCPATSLKPTHQKIATRSKTIGENLTIRRALPQAARRMIGAWCFLDHFGPLNLKTSKGLQVAPHPHMGLQTFTWLLHGDILHRDSLGSLQVIHPGQVNLMTAGTAISHSEESLPDSILHGVQLWIALPDSERHRAPDFAHYAEMPVCQLDGVQITVLVGEFMDQVAPSHVYSPLIGLDLSAKEETVITIPVNPQFEYGALPLIGYADVADERIDLETLLYLGCGRSTLTLRMPAGARLLLIGGEPFNEEILIWWNFVARTKAEIVDATQAWNQRQRFGEVAGYPGNRLDAPDMP